MDAYLHQMEKAMAANPSLAGETFAMAEVALAWMPGEPAKGMRENGRKSWPDIRQIVGI